MGNLILVGTGIKSIAHMTHETENVIKNVEKVIYLLNEPYLIEWIKRESKLSESLDTIYFSNNSRLKSYKAITNFIISEYSKYKSLCAVFYGHPTVFANSGLWAVQKIKQHGGCAVILPSISSLDCLFAELEINPGHEGCYFADATEFLVKNKTFDSSSHVILFQVGLLGSNTMCITKKILVLQEYLLKFYPKNHPVYFYEASRYPTLKSKIAYFLIESMHTYPLSHLETLYIPPLPATQINDEMVKKLEINISHF